MLLHEAQLFGNSPLGGGAPIVVRARRDGGKNKDCSELHDAIFASVVTQGRNSGATAVDCEQGNRMKVFLVLRNLCIIPKSTLRSQRYEYRSG